MEPWQWLLRGVRGGRGRWVGNPLQRFEHRHSPQRMSAIMTPALTGEGGQAGVSNSCHRCTHAQALSPFASIKVTIASITVCLA
mmetsp:Transcript_24213/g.60916  ORF Transcript_24213/g.60916 Transcript_24213/m.60916 type:complete len:84 (+) Transcript_24213:341-592(+)